MLSQIVYDFEAAHQNGDTPRLQDFVPADAPDRTAVAAELVRIDLEYRSKRGLPISADQYLTPFPELASDKELLRELLEAESRACPSGDSSKTPGPHGRRLTESGDAPWATLGSPAARAPEAVPSVAELLDALRQSQLLGPGRLEELGGDLPSPLPEPQALAVDLVRRGWLTPFQAEQLLRGRGRTLVLGPYVLLERLGEGGMGTVYKARHRSMGRVVALKVIRPERLAQGDTAQRFQREIRALAQLSHANIVTAYHADCAGDTSFLVMEYVEGTDLYRLVEASGPLAVHQACDFIRQAALALQHACECGLVHRDVKPSNLLLMRDRPVIKLLDLGLARHETASISATVPGELTREGVMLGTPDYMAPEQAVDPRRADIRADVYSLGCTLYYLLAARPPFPEGTLTQKLLWHQQAEPPRIEDLRPGLPAGLPAVLRKMMARRPEDRYQTPTEAAAALVPFTTPAPAEARADGPPPLPPAEGVAFAPTQSLSETPPAPDAGKLLAQAGKLLTRLLKSDGGEAEAPAAQDESRTVAGVEPAARESGPKRRTRREPGSRTTGVDNEKVAKLLVRVGRMLMQVGKMLAVVLILVIGGVVYWLAIPPVETKEQFLARIGSLIRQEQFKEALEQIQVANQDELDKAVARKDVKNAALPWADDQVQKKQHPGKVREVLDLLRSHFPGEDRLAQLRGRAHELDVQQQVAALSDRQRYRDALDMLRQQAPELAEAAWARDEKDRILQAWTDGAADLLKAKQFKKAHEFAQVILEAEKGYGYADQVRAQAADQIKTITAAVTEQLNKKEFMAAYDQLVKDWPSDEDQLKEAILKQWLAAAEQLRKDKQWKEADATLVAMATRYNEDGHKVAINALRREVARARVRAPVELALKEQTWPRLKAAADILTSKDATSLELGERQKLRAQLEQAWVARSLKEAKAEQRTARLRELPIALRGPATKAALENISVNASLSTQITEALHLQGVTKAEFATIRGKLQALQGKALDAKDRKRIESLLVLLDRAQKGAEQPLSDAVEAFETSLKKSTDLIPADRAALEPIPGRLFALRVRQSVPTPAEDVKEWEKRLADCQKVKKEPDTWVLACHVECLAELKKLKQDVDPDEWDRAWRDLREHLDKRQPAPEAEPYAHYVRALALAASDKAASAADLMTQEIAKKDLPAELRVAHRKQRAAEVLLQAAEALRSQGKGPLREPFGAEGGADKAFPWLDLANRLAGPAAKDDLRCNLVLAAWYKQQPDNKLAGQVAAELLRKESLDKLNPSEAFLFSLINARTRDDSPAGRKVALESYQTALERLRGLLRARLGPVATKAFRENTLLPACELFSIDVINPLCSKEGLAQFLPADAGAELKAQMAQLAAGSAALITADQAVWMEVKHLGKNPLEKAVNLYNQAFQLAGTAEEKAEYLVHKAFAHHALPHRTLQERQEALKKLQEYAREAITMAPQYAGGYALRGVALVYESREVLDYGKKLELLRKADGELSVGLQLRAKLPRDKADQLSLLLYQTFGSVCLELGNYVAAKAEKAKYLHRGKEYLEQLLKIEPKNLEAWDIYGLLLEDIGLYVGEPETYYARARDAVGKAMDEQFLWAGRTKPWLSRGRIQVRWATLGGKGAADLMAAAAVDLQQVTKFGGDSLEAAEAYLWRGKLETLQKNPERAEQAFRQALRRFRAARSSLWEEAVLHDWCNLALAEANTRLAKSDYAGATKYADVVEARGRELEKFSKASAALFLVNAHRAKRYARLQQTDPDTLLALLAGGLEGERLQDRAMHVYILAERARLYIEGTEVTKDVVKAYKDAAAALKLAEQVAVPEEARALPLGIAGEACLNYQNAHKFFPEAVAKLRQAIKLAPAHFKAWWWKGLLTATLMNQKYDANGQDRANLLEEAARNIAEANNTAPASTPQGVRAWFRGLQKETEEKALPVLQKAVKDNGQAEDAWRWHWRLAEIRAANGERLPALNHVRQAEQRIPADAPAAQRDRIVALRKQLEEGQ
jgi:serine/threonine protein kinase